MTATPVRMDPRIRERRIEVARAAGRRRLRVLMLVAGAGMIVALGYLTVNSPLLDVDHIRVAGATHVADDAIIAASGVHRHDALMLIDLHAVTRRIERLPWVASATVHREYPGTLRITIKEFTPTAYVRVGKRVLLIAPTGRVIAPADHAPVGAAEIRGVRHVPNVGDLLAPPEAANIVQALPRALAQQVVAVNVGGAGIALDLASGGEVRLGSTDGVTAKAAAAIAVLARNAGAPFSYLDVSTPQTPVLHR